MPRIAVSFASRPDEVVVRLAGQAGISQAGELAARLLPLSACRPLRLILDLTGLEFISCLAVGVLSEFRRWLARTGTRVYLAPGVQKPVREALDRAGLLLLFDLPPGTDSTPPTGVVTRASLSQQEPSEATP
jgi:anti-anti-sigma factor